MKIIVLFGSPHKEGNTKKLLDVVIKRLNEMGHETETIYLYDKKIKPCLGCFACQKQKEGFGCVQNDDAQKIAEKILESDQIILATPIYSWFCTGVMKNLLDRIVFFMNKIYLGQKGTKMMKSKKISLVITCGLEPKTSTDLFERGMMRFAIHCGMFYMGSVHIKCVGKPLTDENKKSAVKFADFIVKQDMQ
ncbi:MAG: flavodoxin family protein [Clostridia bacterium]|jgi:multimeric flavodoxin WrbA|nr:flavodoxin family protein [Clostridia bacterium]MCI1998972.1 flavodoxin family protein [Clostridia bacterium]MCI2013722.1 flavodoxin family protein [Clostridia bacterium]